MLDSLFSKYVCSDNNVNSMDSCCIQLSEYYKTYGQDKSGGPPSPDELTTQQKLIMSFHNNDFFGRRCPCVQLLFQSFFVCMLLLVTDCS